jgi:hypothetical protein
MHPSGPTYFRNSTTLQSYNTWRNRSRVTQARWGPDAGGARPKSGPLFAFHGCEVLLTRPSLTPRHLPSRHTQAEVDLRTVCTAQSPHMARRTFQPAVCPSLHMQGRSSFSFSLVQSSSSWAWQDSRRPHTGTAQNREGDVCVGGTGCAFPMTTFHVMCCVAVNFTGEPMTMTLRSQSDSVLMRRNRTMNWTRCKPQTRY